MKKRSNESEPLSQPRLEPRSNQGLRLLVVGVALDLHVDLVHAPGLVDVDFSAGRVSSDCGGLLLREVDLRFKVCARLAECFVDHRREELVEHSVEELLRQRVLGLALGYEDLNDHDLLGQDPLMATLIGKADVEGQARRMPKDRGRSGASASTLGRLERTPSTASARSRYAKIVCDFDALQRTFVQLFIESVGDAPDELVLDLDPSDIQLHGTQEQHFFHGYYDHYCYLPLYLYCGEYPLAVRLRPANIDGALGALGAVDMLRPVVAQLREAYPATRLIIRGDGGFCREELMSWCEATEGVEFVFGMARKARLQKALTKQMNKARATFERTGRAAREFRSFRYRTLKTWSRERRVIGKAEYLSKGENPRFVVTSLRAKDIGKRALYEQLYCARGEMENRIKEQQLDLFGTRASAHAFRANHVRVWNAFAAQLLIVLLRNHALQGTPLARAQAGTLRVRLFKIGALITVSVRRVYVRLSSAFPLPHLLRHAMRQLRRPPPIHV